MATQQTQESPSPIKEFYIEKGIVRERLFTVTYQQFEQATQFSGGTVIRVRKIIYDRAVDPADIPSIPPIGQSQADN